MALLNAEQEVGLATQIEAGLYAGERVRRAEDVTEKLSPQLRRDLLEAKAMAKLRHPSRSQALRDYFE